VKRKELEKELEALKRDLTKEVSTIIKDFCRLVPLKLFLSKIAFNNKHGKDQSRDTH
jgi:hypothetical protein